MSNILCHSGNMASPGNLGAWGWVGLILNLVFWVGLIASLTLLVVWAIRSMRVPAATVPSTIGQPSAKEILHAQYARGEINSELYERWKQDIDKPKD
jgi:putative membrane protein